jgi:putative transposase
MLTEDAARRAISSSGRAARRRFFPLRTQHRIGLGIVSNNGQHVPWPKLPMEAAASGWGTHDLRAVISGQPVTLRFKQHRRARKSWSADDPRHRLHLVPENAVVHTAWAQLVRRANKWDLELCLSVDMPTEPTRTGDRSIGIDAGYRAIGEHSVRAASTSTGEHIETPPLYLDRVRQSEALHSVADRMTREMWEACYGPVPTHAGREWSVRRLHRTILCAPYVRQAIGGRDAGERWKAGERTHDAYRLQHRHLMLWSDALREKSRRARLDHYRVTSARLAREHDAIVVESLRLDNMARSRIAGGRRVDAAPSELRAALKAAASTYGARHVQVPAYDTSQTCSACTVVHPVGTARDGEAFACPSCGFVAHADINAAVNIRARAIASGEVPRESPQPLAKAESSVVSSPSVASRSGAKRSPRVSRARKQLALAFDLAEPRNA